MRTNLSCNDSETVSDPPDSSAFIELTGILHEPQLYAVFRAGPSERICRVDASDVVSFTAFQQRIAKELGPADARCQQMRADGRRPGRGVVGGRGAGAGQGQLARGLAEIV